MIAGLVSAQSAGLNQTQLDNLAENMAIRVKVLDNTRHDLTYHIVRTTLINNGNSPIPSSGWTLYFHSMLLVYPGVFPTNKTTEMSIEKVEVGMVQGDLYFMRPIDGFVEIDPGKERDYDIPVQYWAVQKTDFMPNWYVVSDDESVTPRICRSTASTLDYVEAFTDVRQWKRGTIDRFNPYTAQERMENLGFEDTGKVSKF